MITEHNFEKIYLLQIKTVNGWRFMGPGLPLKEEKAGRAYVTRADAERYLQQRNPDAFGEEIRIVPIEFPYRLEYQIDPRIDVWQKMRTYRTLLVAIAGFYDYVQRVRTTALGEHIWRLVVASTGEVLEETVPFSLVSPGAGDRGQEAENL